MCNYSGFNPKQNSTIGSQNNHFQKARPWFLIRVISGRFSRPGVARDTRTTHAMRALI
jgi:hypothetical protein